MKAVLAGASGLVGGRLRSRLLADPGVTELLCVVRRPSPARHPKYREVIVTDFGRLAEHRAELAGDHYFCALGTTIKAAGTQEKFRAVDHDAVLAFAQIAAQNGARSFSLVSAAGANPKSLIFYNRVKGETESDIALLALSKLYIYRPGLLLGTRQEFRLGERIFVGLATALAPFIPEAVLRRAATRADTLAAKMIEVAQSGAAGHVFLPSEI